MSSEPPSDYQPPADWQPPAGWPPPARRRNWWSIAGTALAVVAAVGGLAIMATAVLVFVALSTGKFKVYNK
jgi:hypothetical protein